MGWGLCEMNNVSRGWVGCGLQPRDAAQPTAFTLNRKMQNSLTAVFRAVCRWTLKRGGPVTIVTAVFLRVQGCLQMDPAERLTCHCSNRCVFVCSGLPASGPSGELDLSQF